MSARRNPEARLQVAVAAFLRLALRLGTYWSAIDHGAGRMTPASAGLRKARGVKPGLPDILVVHDGWPIAIELKADKGRVSSAQEVFAWEWREAGGHYAVCKSVEEVEKYLRGFGIPLCATVVGRSVRATARAFTS